MPTGSHRALLFAMLLAAGLAVIAYWPSLGNEFVYDDVAFIVMHPAVGSDMPWYRCWLEPVWPRGVGTDKIYRPLTLWSYRLNAWLTGGVPQPRAFHMVNIGLHAITSALVVWLAFWVVRAGRGERDVTGDQPGFRPPLAGLIAGALFATHPVHTEAVATGYGRSEVLAALFSTWLLIRFIRGWVASSAPVLTTARASFRFHLGNSLLFLAAIMSKENAALLWPVLLMLEAWSRRRPAPGPGAWRAWLNQRLAPAHVGFLMAIAVFLFFRYLVFGWSWYLEAERVRVWESPVTHANLLEHLLVPFRLLALSAELLVWPPRLCPIWSVSALPLPDGISIAVLAGMALALACGLGGLVLWRRGRIAGPLLLGLLVVMSLAIHAIPAARWLFAERWLYLPTVLVAVLLAAAVVRGGGIAASAAAALAVGLLPCTWHYTAAFHDNLALGRTVALRQPNSFPGWTIQARVLLMEGQYHEAIRAAHRCVAVVETVPAYRPPREPYEILVRGYLALGDAKRATAALIEHDRAAAHIPGPTLTRERQQIQELLETP